MSIAQSTFTQSTLTQSISTTHPTALQRSPIAIIGMAALFPDAANLRDYWSNILQGRDCITDVPPSRWSLDDYYDPDPSAPDKTYSKRGGFIPDVTFDPLEFGLPPHSLEVTDTSQLLALGVAKAALQDAGYAPETSGASAAIYARTGVVLGAGGGQKLINPLTSRLQYPVWEKVLRSRGLSETETQSIIEQIKLAYVAWDESAFPGLLGNVIAGRIANRFNLGGMNCVVDAACASSLSALKMAISELLEGRSDMMITGGVDTDNSIFMYMCFSKTPAFSQQGQVRPFDGDADGMLVGEGLGMLVLKRLVDAERDGDRIYAVIKGIGASSDGRFRSIYAPRAAGQAVALQRAYADAGYPAASVSLVEAHGTGTVAGDLAELEALKAVFGAEGAAQQSIALGSVKSQIGHTKATAGAAGLIKTALALHHKILPPTINITQPNPKFALAESPFYLNTEARPWVTRGLEMPRRAGVSAFGFGGANFHVALEEYQPEAAGQYRLHMVAQSLLFCAATPAELLQECQTALDRLLSDAGQAAFAAFVANAQSQTLPPASARVGFVAADPQEAATLLSLVIEQLTAQPAAEEWRHPRGIHYRRQGMETRGKVVALFPGQGSQSLGMGRELANNFPLLRQTFAQLDAPMQAAGCQPLASVIFPPPTFDPTVQKTQAALLTRTEYAQPAIGALSFALYKLVQAAGFAPDYLAGHSFGELTALWAAGVLTDTDFLFLAQRRGQAMAAAPTAAPESAMLAVQGDANQLQSTIATVAQLTLANLNSPRQTVIAGARAVIEQAQQQLAAQGYTVRPLPVAAAFHTPFVAHAQAPFRQAIDQVTFAAPHTPVYTNTTGQRYPDNPLAIQATLAAHLLQPVRFHQEIETIYAAGGRIFVEIGPKNVLTNLVRETLGDRPHFALALNPSPTQDSDRQLRDALVQLRVIGLPLGPFDEQMLTMPSAPAKPVRPGTVILNGNNYVSERTKMAFQQTLHPAQNPAQNNGVDLNESSTRISALPTLAQAAPIAIPHATCEAACATPAATLPSLQPHNAPADTLLNQVMRLQSDTMNAHTQYLQTQQLYAQLLTSLLDHPTAQQIISQSTAVIPSALPLVAAPLMPLSSPPIAAEAPIERQSLPVVEAPPHQTIPAPVAAPTPMTPPVLTPIAQEQSVQPQAAILPTNVPPPAPSMPIPTATQRELTESLLAVVSDKTGYPVEMLEPEMDMEADLGIDSIKRVEILGVMQQRYPDLPKLNPEVLAELHTLAQIIDYIAVRLNGTAPDATPIINESPLPTVAKYPVRLKSLPTPDHLHFALPPDHVCLVTEDGGGTSHRLARLLAASGWRVVLLSFPPSIVPNRQPAPPDLDRVALQEMSEGHLQQRLAGIEAMYGRVGAFVHINPLPSAEALSQDQPIFPEAEQAILQHVLLIAKHLQPSLTAAAAHSRSCFLTVARLDGHLGVGSNGNFSALGGGLFGLTKSLRHEWANVYCRAIDLSPTLNDEEAAHHIIAELYDPNRLLAEVGYNGQGRVTLVAE